MTTSNPEQGQRSFTGLEARRLLRQVRTAALGTINRDDGGPYVSLINVATDLAGWPIIFISRLAWHTQNILNDTKASVLAQTLPERGDALTGARMTVMGRFEQVEAEIVRHRYLARHPEASFYAEFPDFAFWRLKPERIHAVAGFGRIETMPAEEVFPKLENWEELERSAVTHINDDHSAAVRHHLTSIAKQPDGAWQVAAVDPDGCDAVSGDKTWRLNFDAPALDAEALRMAFARLFARSE